MNSDNDPKAVISEVGSNESRNEEKIPEITYAEKLLCSMETLLARVLAVQAPVVSNNRSPLLKFDPDDTESDIDDWCKVTEVIVQSKRLEGVDLLVALTGALKGHAATCITKLNLDEITWESVKEMLIARFSKPKLIQDHFDDVLRFQIGAKETASESALRLWNLIEKIPKSTMCEEVITGFVISVLCQKDNLIRRELNAQTVTGRAQLFRILGGISLKRRLDAEAQEPEAKRARLAEKFPGKCHYCGLTGHRIAECRKRRNDAEPKTQEASSSSRSTEKRPVVTCYVCGQSGHVATVCPDRKSNSGAAVKEVHRCEHRSSRGTLKTSSGEIVSFLFDSGSSCSLVKESFCEKLRGTAREDLVYLSGIGGNDVKCTTQVQSQVTIDELTVNLLFHVVPDTHISDPILVGRDIFDLGLCVKIDNDNLVFFSKEQSHYCDLKSDKLDLSKIDTDLEGKDKASLMSL
ncbi:uncharacterized protein LOC142984731 [Anticarsia gemmatalis]|uniref:uncharacterized protein LOC142984731 n=1 Tax=Anticarsia gemmatalis TaxID=129554 RepID=UPI003F75DAEF